MPPPVEVRPDLSVFSDEQGAAIYFVQGEMFPMMVLRESSAPDDNGQWSPVLLGWLRDYAQSAEGALSTDRFAIFARYEPDGGPEVKLERSSGRTSQFREAAWVGAAFGLDTGHSCRRVPFRLESRTVLFKGALFSSWYLVEGPAMEVTLPQPITRSASAWYALIASGIDLASLWAFFTDYGPLWAVPTDSLLSGRWRGDDGGLYMLHHDKRGGRLAWSAGSTTPEHRPVIVDAGANPVYVGPAEGWSHVFYGTRTGASGTRFSGPWADNARGAMQGQGLLEIEVVSQELLEVRSSSGGHGLSVLKRESNADGLATISVEAQTLGVLAGGSDEDPGPGIFIALANDGEITTYSSYWRDFEGFDWGNDLDVGERLLLPDGFGELSGDVRIFDSAGGPVEDSWLVVACRVYDLDNSRGGDRRRDYEAWRASMEHALGRWNGGPAFSRVEKAAGARWSTFRWRNDDDFIGAAVRLWRRDELAELCRRGTPEDVFLEMGNDRRRYDIQLELVGACTPICDH